MLLLSQVTHYRVIIVLNCSKVPVHIDRRRPSITEPDSVLCSLADRTHSQTLGIFLLGPAELVDGLLPSKLLVESAPSPSLSAWSGADSVLAAVSHPTSGITCESTQKETCYPFRR